MKFTDWKFKEDAKPQGGSDGFWYDITKGGYIKPEDFLSDASQIAKIKEAVNILESFETALEDNELLNEF